MVQANLFAGQRQRRRRGEWTRGQRGDRRETHWEVRMDVHTVPPGKWPVGAAQQNGQLSSGSVRTRRGERGPRGRGHSTPGAGPHAYSRNRPSTVKGYTPYQHMWEAQTT